MGFDLYGLSPHNPTNAIRPEQLDWSKKHSDKERDEYFDAVDSYEKTVIGSYFRNNVWWWRPLWQFVTMISDDILTEKDVSEGGFNGGHKISKKKAEAIADRLYSLFDNGQIEEYEKEYQEHLNSLNDKDWDKHYPFHKDNVREFANFCANCRGFEIC